LIFATPKPFLWDARMSVLLPVDMSPSAAERVRGRKRTMPQTCAVSARPGSQETKTEATEMFRDSM
jgi:hypothetical protein